MSIAEKLQTLQDTKVAIKAAIEDKGQDLTDVPFTGYAEKIAAIKTGAVDKAGIIKELIELRNGNADYLFYGGTKTFTDENIAEFIKYDTLENAKSLPYAFYDNQQVTHYPKMNTSNVTNWLWAFCRNVKLEEAPDIDLSSTTQFGGVFSTCWALKTVPSYNTKKVTSVNQTFAGCSELKTIGEWDLRSCTNYSGFVNSPKLEEIRFKNIKADIQVGKGTSYGHLLKQESAIHLLYELRDTGSAKTITFSTKTGELLANVYVKSIPITDEMRAEDDLVDEKLPFVVCESTDEGATLITEYVLQKNWQVALA